ncbi:MAG TPA: DegQ family serine endoprotease [Burkholderiaceae bacterium]|nr:DegQ family serine endoprotease [Burkholderiaceae bacterium]
MAIATQFLKRHLAWRSLGGFVLAAALGSLAASPPALGQALGGTGAVRGLPDFSDLVEQVGPSVVNIRTVEKASSRNSPFNFGGEDGMDEELKEFFRRFFGQTPNAPRGGQPQRPQRPPEDEARPRGVGSGFVLTSDGYVMTNAHVVDGAEEVLVTLTDKREFKAKIIGADARTDVAVVKIEASGLPAVRIGDVNRLRVGEWVMAIGSPFGLENSVTAGIVSAKQRDTGDYLPFIQTDVAINPGNSGGPLINLRGEVVGINSQIYSRSGGYMGIAFAIPIDEAIRVSEHLRATGKVVRGRIGVSIEPVSKDVAESIGLGRPQGAMVRGVDETGPAAKGGIEAGDVIVKFDGKPIDKASDLPRLVGNTKPGTRSTVTVLRRGSYKDVSVTVAELPSDTRPARATPAPKEDKPKTGSAQGLGLTVAELSETQKKELKLKGGVRVEAVADAAARAGLREGDVVLQIANQEVAGVKEFEAITAKLDRAKPVNLLVRRGEWAQYVLIRPAAK